MQVGSKKFIEIFKYLDPNNSKISNFKTLEFSATGAVTLTYFIFLLDRNTQ